MLRRLTLVSFRVANVDDKCLTLVLLLTDGQVVAAVVFHSAFGMCCLVIVVLSESLLVSKSDGANVRVAFVFADLKIVRVH